MLLADAAGWFSLYLLIFMPTLKFALLKARRRRAGAAMAAG